MRRKKGICGCVLILLVIALLTGCARPATSSSDSGANLSAPPSTIEVSSIPKSQAEPFFDNVPPGETACITAHTIDRLGQPEGGLWYFYREAPPPDQGILQYTFSFDAAHKTMMWSIGYFQSEGVNNFRGVYEIDENNLITGMLTDEYKNASVTIEFMVEYLLDSESSSESANYLIVTIVACSDERFSDIVGCRLGYDAGGFPTYIDRE